VKDLKLNLNRSKNYNIYVVVSFTILNPNSSCKLPINPTRVPSDPIC
jgi:hypothetical protein